SSESRSSWFLRPSTVFFGPGAPLKPHDPMGLASPAAARDKQRMGRELHQLAALASDFSRSLLIFSTIPALRSATSLTLYSADVPSTCATSDGVNLYSSANHSAMFAVALRNASSNDPLSPIAMMCVGDSTRGPMMRLPGITSTVNSTSMDVSSAFPLSSPSPCSACPSPTYSSAPGT